MQASEGGITVLNVAVLLYDGVEELDFVGPYEVFSFVGKVCTVADAPSVRGRHGLQVMVDQTFTSASQPDVLVVPGGPVTRENPEALEASVAFVRRMAPECRVVQGVSTGTFILALAGVLNGRSCTTHYRRRHLLSARFPEVRLRYGRVVTDGKFITTAGVAAGIDGSLFTVSKLLGVDDARRVAKRIEYPWHSAQVLHAGTMEDAHDFPEDRAQSRAW